MKSLLVLLISLQSIYYTAYAWEQIVLQSPSNDVCADKSLPRHDCGFSGISQRECQVRNCCWSPSKSHNLTMTGEPWCFYKDQEPEKSYTCNVDVSARGDCGWLGISEKECRARRCCWSPSGWCFASHEFDSVSLSINQILCPIDADC